MILSARYKITKTTPHIEKPLYQVISYVSSYRVMLLFGPIRKAMPNILKLDANSNDLVFNRLRHRFVC